MCASLSDTNEGTHTSKPVVETVVNAIARIEGIDPVDLSDPVFAFVDPDALDRLVASAPAETDLSVAFEAWGHEIVIAGDGTIRIDGEVRDQASAGGVTGTRRGIHR